MLKAVVALLVATTVAAFSAVIFSLDMGALIAPELGRIDRGKNHSMLWHYGLWLAFAAIAVGMGIVNLIAG